MVKLEDFKDEVSTLFSAALLALGADDYAALCDYTQQAMEGQV